jgi:hypothetical protein
MNEQIETLAKVAGYDMINKAAMRALGFDVEKFAELIVKECADMCFKASQESFRLNEVKAGAMGMALKVLIEDHFGVEE